MQDNLSRSGYQALPLGDFDRFQQSSIGLYGSQKGFFSFGPAQDPVAQNQNTTDSSQGWLSWICHGIVTFLVFLLMVITFPISGWFALKIVPAYERMIVFRLGRIRAPQGPGVVLLLPFIDQWQRVDLRTRAFSVPPCKLTSKDGAVISMGADVQFRVWDPALSVMMVKDLIAATRMTAQNAMTKNLLKKSLREIQTEKLRIGDQLLLEINDMTKSWGLEVDRVELILEAVLQSPQESHSGPLTMMPPIPGLEGLDSTIQHLAMHFFSNSMATAANPNVAPETAESVETVNEVEPPAPTITTTTTTAATTRRKLGAEELLSTVELFLSESLVSQVGASYQFNILLPSGARSTYFIDLSTGSGKVGCGVPEHNPDVILEMTEKDLQAFFLGELRPLTAYMSGRLRVKGDLNVALKLEELFKAMKQQEARLDELKRVLKKESHEARNVKDLQAGSLAEFLEGAQKRYNLFCEVHEAQILSIYCSICCKPKCCTCAILDSKHRDQCCDIKAEILRRQEELCSLSEELKQKKSHYETVLPTSGTGDIGGDADPGRAHESAPAQSTVNPEVAPTRSQKSSKKIHFSPSIAKRRGGQDTEISPSPAKFIRTKADDGKWDKWARKRNQNILEQPGTSSSTGNGSGWMANSVGAVKQVDLAEPLENNVPQEVTIISLVSDSEGDDSDEESMMPQKNSHVKI
ncbi:stomatin-like protein 1 isoform A [Alligator mississippiensis]|uniref:Stomatin-like protein 1 n=1 Tax=Alligator mississippiensis TaxID=8496 RepID=A0A151MAI5_ALLMI|nr:stomatin-like protein 1 isoform A [Alligator mississippiensis]